MVSRVYIEKDVREHPRAQQILKRLDRLPLIDIEHGHCCLSNGSRTWSTSEFWNALRFLKRFFDQWPDHLTADLAK